MKHFTLFFLLPFHIVSHAYDDKKLIWSDEFDFLDQSKWVHLVTTYPLVDYIQIYMNSLSDSCRIISTTLATTVPTVGFLKVNFI